MTPQPTTASPRRVTVIAHELRGFLPVGGMGTATTFLALALARSGHSVEILLGKHSPASIDPYWASVYESAEVRIRPAPDGHDQVEPWQFVHPHRVELGLQAGQADVVIAHDFGAPVYSALRLRQADLAFQNSLFVVFCHGTRRYVADLSPNLALKDLDAVLGVSLLEQATVELADVVVSPSAYLIDWMRDKGWQLPERTLVIPYFTRFDATGEDAWVAERPHPDPLRRIAFFGRVDEKKGLRIFTAAVNALEPELIAGLQLDFVGKTTASWPRERVERLLSGQTRRALGQVVFETGLDQHEALARIRLPGTLAVMPSLQENSPNTVYECLEHAIPFIASNVGGVPELVAPDDRLRVLFEPTPEGVESALRRVLSEENVPAPARAAFDPGASFGRWAEVVQMRPAGPVAPHRDEPTIDVIVVHRDSRAALSSCLAALREQSYAAFAVTVAATSQARHPQDVAGARVVTSAGSSVEGARQAGLEAGSAEYIVFLDEEDVPDDVLLETLLQALRGAQADVATCGIRVPGTNGETTLHFFSGDPGGLGAVDNAYGGVGLFKRTVLGNLTPTWPSPRDADWPLLARVVASGASIVSVPRALVRRAVVPATVANDGAGALLVAQHLEGALPDALRGSARLVAGLAARSDRTSSRPTRNGPAALSDLARRSWLYVTRPTSRRRRRRSHR